jgi:hypothetical protein
MLLTRSRVGFAAVITVLIVAGFGFLLLTAGAHPYILTRFSAAKAIRSAAEFQHKTKVSIAGGNPWPISSDPPGTARSRRRLRIIDGTFLTWRSY